MTPSTEQVTTAGTRRWTTRADAVAVLAKRWRRGDLPAAVAAGRPVVPQQVTLTGPGPREVTARFGEVQSWVRSWEGAATGLRVESAPIGGRLVGTNLIPVRAWVDDEAHLWRLLGVTAEVAALRAVRAHTDQHFPELSSWVTSHPREALAAAPVWERVAAVVRWIIDHGGPAVQLRHIDVPRVDTKFVETNRALLAALLDLALPAGRIDASRPRTEFAARYGLGTKPSYVRLRRLDGTPLFPGVSGGGPATDVRPAELTVRATDLSVADVPARAVVVVENETTYLALPPFPEVVAVFGGGYAASRLGALGWLSDRPLLYWGDLDTHGFAILDGLRAVLPHARSVLMDRVTLELHRDHWGTETIPSANPLGRLDELEQALFRDLVEGRYGLNVRLEQERIRFGHAQRCLGAALEAPG